MDSKSIGLCPQGLESPRCRCCVSAANTPRIGQRNLGSWQKQPPNPTAVAASATTTAMQLLRGARRDQGSNWGPSDLQSVALPTEQLLQQPQLSRRQQQQLFNRTYDDCHCNYTTAYNYLQRASLRTRPADLLQANTKRPHYQTTHSATAPTKTMAHSTSIVSV